MEKPDFSRAVTDQAPGPWTEDNSSSPRGSLLILKAEGVGAYGHGGLWEKREDSKRNEQRGVSVSLCCVWIPTQPKFGHPNTHLFPLSPWTQLVLHGPLGVAMLSGALKKLKCLLRNFQQNASSSELMQNQGRTQCFNPYNEWTQ